MSATAVKPRLITAKEFEKFNPEWRYDLIEGELRPMPPMPGYEHGVITNIFTVNIGAYVIQKRLGQCFAAETRFTIQQNPDTSIGPDWAFIRKERLPKPIPRGFAAIAPDAVLEVRSPSDRLREVEEKIQRWLNAGVRIVWELDPKTKVMTVYRPGEDPRRLSVDDTLSGEDVLPDFTLPLRQLFETDEVE